MVEGDIGGDEEDEVGGLHVGVGAGWAVGAEGEFVAGDRGGHTESSVAVVIAGAKSKLNEFAEGVELLGEELPGTHNTERFVTVPLLDVEKALDHRVECLVPGDWRENAVLAQEWLFSAAGRGEDVVLGETLGAALGAIGRMGRIATGVVGLASTHSQTHAATDA